MKKRLIKSAYDVPPQYPIVNEQTVKQHTPLEDTMFVLDKAPKLLFHLLAYCIFYDVNNDGNADSLLEKVQTKINHVLGKNIAVDLEEILNRDEETFDVKYKVYGTTTVKGSNDFYSKVISNGGLADVISIEVKPEKIKAIEKQYKENNVISDDNATLDDKLRLIAKYISKQTLINPDFVFAQLKLETGNGELQNYHNYGGLKAQGDFERDEKGHAFFQSDKEFADNWIKQVGKPYELNKAKTLEDYVELLAPHDGTGDYFTSSKQKYYENLAYFLGKTPQKDLFDNQEDLST